MKVFWPAIVTNLKKSLATLKKTLYRSRRTTFAENGTTYYDKLAIGLFRCEKLLLPNTKVRLKLISASPKFYMISYNPQVSL